MGYGGRDPFNFSGLNFDQFGNPQDAMQRLLRILRGAGLEGGNINRDFLQTEIDNPAGAFGDTQLNFFRNLLNGTTGGTGDRSYGASFDEPVSRALDSLGPNAFDRLFRIFLGGPNGGDGGEDGRGQFYRYFKDQLDENGQLRVGGDQLRGLLEGGLVRDPTQSRFIEKILAAMGGGGTGDPNGDFPDGGGGGGGGGGGAGGGGGGGGGFGGFESLFGSNFGVPDNDFLQWLEGQIKGRVEGNFGVPQDIMDANRAALQETARVSEQSGMQQLAAGLNTRGQLGGGRQITASQDILNNSNTALQNSINSMNMGNAQLAVQDRASAFGEALGLGNIFSGRDLGFGNLQLQEMLGLGNMDLQQQSIDNAHELGMGNLGLATNQFQFQSMMQLFMQQLMGSLGLF